MLTGRDSLGRLRERVRGLMATPCLTTLLSMGLNLTFALFNAVFSLVFDSWWHLTLSALSLLLGLMRLSAVAVSRSGHETASVPQRRTGLAMFALAIIVCGMQFLVIREAHNPVMLKALVIADALYPFIFLGLAVRNIWRAHRQQSEVLVAVRGISCACAVISMLALERSMIGTFGNAYGHSALAIQAWSGGAAFAILVGLGVGMLVRARRSPGSWEG